MTDPEMPADNPGLTPDVRRPRVKVCGHRSAEAIAGSVAAGVDAIGVISEVTVDTHREVDPGTAADLLGEMPPFVTGVLVTMPETPADALDLIDITNPNAIQLHGALTPSEVGEVAAATPIDVIATVEATAPDQVTAYATQADAVLVDSADAEGAGGTGRTHDWERTRAAVTDCPSPVILAGGLSPTNVAEAVATVEPFGVDAATGIEDEHGHTDPTAVQQFVTAATEGGGS